MKHRTFFWFILPSLTAMALFIALPIVSILVQSLFIEPQQVVVRTQSCGPFGCTQSTTVDAAATARLRAEQPLGRFNGLAPISIAPTWPRRKSRGPGGTATASRRSARR